MKKTLQLINLSFLIMVFSFTAQGKGVDFAQGSWSEVKKLALQQQKPIFVEAFANWCTPCKHLNASVFSQNDVGALYNNNFISYKMDIDTFEGQEFTLIYEVSLIPDFLFFSPNGQLLLRSNAISSKSQILDVAHSAIRSNNQFASLASAQREPINRKQNKESYNPLTQPNRAVVETGHSAVTHNNTTSFYSSKQYIVNQQSSQTGFKFVKQRTDTYVFSSNNIGGELTTLPAEFKVNLQSYSELDLELMEKHFDAGLQTANFLHDYAYALESHELPYEGVVNRYIRKQKKKKDFFSIKNQIFILHFLANLQTEALNTLLQEKAVFAINFGHQQVEDIIKNALLKITLQAAINNDVSLYKKVKQLTKKADLKNQSYFVSILDNIYKEI